MTDPEEKGKVLSLSRVRKARKRFKKRAQADANAVKFGQRKIEKSLLDARTEKARRDLDGHRRE